MKFYLLLTLLWINLAIGQVAVKLTPQDQSRLRVARVLLRDGDYAQALTIYNRFLEQGKLSPEVVQGLRQAYEGLQDYLGLVRFYARLANKFPNQVHYRVELGRAYFLAGKKDSAHIQWQRVYQSRPQRVYNYRLVANVLAELHRFDEAAEIYQQALKKFPKQARYLYRDLAMLYRSQLNYEQAVHYFLLYYRYQPAQKYTIRAYLLTLTRDQEATERILQALLRELQENSMQDAFWQEVVADLYMRGRQYNQALEWYKRLAKKHPNGRYLERFAAKAAENGAYAFAVAGYRSALKDLSASKGKRRGKLLLDLARVRIRWARDTTQVLLRKNLLTKAEQDLHALANLGWQSLAASALELLGDLYRDFYSDYDRANGYYQEALKKTSNAKTQARLYLKIARLALKKGRPEESLRYLARVKHKAYVNLSRFYQAEVAYYQGAFASAKRELEGLKSHLAAEDTLYNNVLKRLVLLQNFAEDSVNLTRYARGEWWYFRGGQDSALACWQKVYDAGNELSILAAQKIVQLLFQRKQWLRAESFLKRWLKEHPEDPDVDQAYFWLAQTKENKGQLEQAMEIYQQLLIRYPSSFWVEAARQKARKLHTLLNRRSEQ